MKTKQSAMFACVALALSAGDLRADAGAECGARAEPADGGAALEYFIGSDASFEGVVDEHWAVRGFLDAEAFYGDVPGARASCGLDLALRTDPVDWVLELAQDLALDGGILSFPRSRAALRVVTGLGESVLGFVPYALGTTDADSSRIETGMDVWFETSLGPVVARPGVGFAVRFPDDGSRAFVFRPGARVSFYPEIPLYLDASAAWIRDAGADSFESALSAAWVPLPALSLSAGMDAALSASASSLFFLAGVKLDIVRGKKLSVILPADATFDTDGNITLSIALRIETP